MDDHNKNRVFGHAVTLESPNPQALTQRIHIIGDTPTGRRADCLHGFVRKCTGLLDREQYEPGEYAETE